MRRSLRREVAAVERQRVVKNLRLHNVPSEDEQSEFNRRYSRDLRRRKAASSADDGPVTAGEAAVRKSSRNRGPPVRLRHESTSEGEDKSEEEEAMSEVNDRSSISFFLTHANNWSNISLKTENGLTQIFGQWCLAAAAIGSV